MPAWTRVLRHAALLAGLWAPVGAQEFPLGVVSGRVVNATTAHPVPGATIEVVDAALTASSDSRGRFTMPAVPAGVHRLRVRAVGFAPVLRADVMIGTGKPAVVEIRLEPLPVRLTDVEVVASAFQRSPGLAPGARVVVGEEVRRAPGVQEDVVRSVALLPGVGVTTAGRNDLVVRGGSPFENLFLIDGIEVPNINHFGSQGSTGGPLSLINIDFVDQTAFSAGGFSTKYGDRTASVTSITLRDGNPQRLVGEVNLAATGIGAIVEGPIGRESTFWVGVRRSYLDFVFRAAGFSFVPAYWDGQIKVTTRLDQNNSLTFLGIGAVNSLDFTNRNADDRLDNSRIMAPEQSQYVAGATWQRLLPNAVFTATLGRTFVHFRTFQNDSLNPPRQVFRNESREGETSLRADLVAQLHPRVELNVGNVVKLASRLTYAASLEGDLRRDAEGLPSPLEVDTSFSAVRNATYLEAGYQVSDRVRMSGGVRVDHYGFLAARWRIAPRLRARISVSPRSAVTVSVGRYFQAPSHIWLVGDPDNVARLRPIRADQVVLGLERLVRPDRKVQLEAFYKTYDSYPARLFRPQAVLAPAGFETVTQDIPFGLEPLVSDGRGRSYGVEVFAQQRLGASPWYGLLSVSVSRAEFTALDGERRVGSFDARVIANAMLGYRPNRTWELSGKFRLASGLPTTPVIESGPLAGRLDFGRFNDGPRLPTFHALDVRVDRRWSVRRVQLAVYVDVQNVYGRSNVSRYRWNPRERVVEADESLGVLPTIGVNVEF